MYEYRTPKVLSPYSNVTLDRQTLVIFGVVCDICVLEGGGVFTVESRFSEILCPLTVTFSYEFSIFADKGRRKAP